MTNFDMFWDEPEEMPARTEEEAKQKVRELKERFGKIDKRFEEITMSEINEDMADVVLRLETQETKRWGRLMFILQQKKIITQNDAQFITLSKEIEDWMEGRNEA